MDYEKAYKEALERARQVHTTNVDENKKSTEYIFPELAESKDEKVRKALIDLIYKIYANTSYITCDEHERILTWLEKQKGEQKPVQNEEDKKIIENCIYFLELQKTHHAATFEIIKCITWLNNLKQTKI